MRSMLRPRWGSSQRSPVGVKPSRSPSCLAAVLSSVIQRVIVEASPAVAHSRAARTSSEAAPRRRALGSTHTNTSSGSSGASARRSPAATPITWPSQITSHHAAARQRRLQWSSSKAPSTWVDQKASGASASACVAPRAGVPSPAPSGAVPPCELTRYGAANPPGGVMVKPVTGLWLDLNWIVATLARWTTTSRDSGGA